MCLLSCKINQHPIEKFFGIQRQSERNSENPEELIKNTENIRVTSGIWIDNILGNCQGGKADDSDVHLDFRSYSLNKYCPAINGYFFQAGFPLLSELYRAP